MISYVKIKPTADKAKNWVKGVCTSDDTKPVEGIANGSKLLELDTGKRCVYDEGQTKWIEYGTGEDRSNKPKNVKTEVYEGLLSELLTFENIQKYGAALDAGAIGVAQSLDTTEKMAEIKMGMIYLPPLDDTDPGFFAFGAGLFGTGYFDMLDVSGAEWNKTFSDEAEYIDYVETIFKPELGASIVVRLSKRSSELGYFAYINMNGNPTIIDQIDNLGRFRFTFYYMDKGVEPSGGAKVTTETISGPMSQLFTGWSKDKFDQLAEDISAGRASARVRVQLGTAYFDAQIMPSNNGAIGTLNMAIFTPTHNAVNFFTLLAITYYYLSDEEPISAYMLLHDSQSGVSGFVNITDEQLSQMTGQTSYDLVITRIEEE